MTKSKSQQRRLEVQTSASPAPTVATITPIPATHRAGMALKFPDTDLPQGWQGPHKIAAKARRDLVDLGVSPEVLLGPSASAALGAALRVAVKAACMAANGDPEEPTVRVWGSGGEWVRVDVHVRVRREGTL